MLYLFIAAAFAAVGGVAYLVVRGGRDDDLPMRSLSVKGGLRAARSRDNRQ